MRAKILILLLNISMLTGCTILDVSNVLPIPNEVREKSLQYSVKEPFLPLRGSAYEQVVGEYKVANFTQSFKSTEDEPTVLRLNDNILANELGERDDTLYFFDGASELAVSEKRVWNKIFSKQAFRFDFTKDEKIIWSADCNYQQEHFERVKESTTKKILSFGRHRCNFVNGSHDIEYIANSRFRKQQRIKIKSSDFDINVQPTNLYENEVITDKNGTLYRANALPISSSSGYYFKSKGQIIGAVSFIGSKIWLSRSNSLELNEFLLAASYGALVLDWKNKIRKSPNTFIVSGLLESQNYKKRQ